MPRPSILRSRRNSNQETLGDLTCNSLTKQSSWKVPPAPRPDLTKQVSRRQKIFGEINKSLCDPEYISPSFPKSKDDTEFICSSIRETFLFQSLSQQQRNELINAMGSETFKPNTIIIRQNDPGDFFYVVQSGTVKFIKDDVDVGICNRGAHFGELALVFNCPRAATCIALTECKLWKLDRDTCSKMLIQNEENLREDIWQACSKVDFLKDLSESVRKKIIDGLRQVKFRENHTIFSKGDVGDVFYIIMQGSVKKHNIGFGDSPNLDLTLGPGEVFGARALLTGEKRWATVTCLSDCTTLAISKEEFELKVGNLQHLVDHSRKRIVLMSVPIFANSYFTQDEMQQLANKLQKVNFVTNHIIEDHFCLYLIQKGSVMTVHDNGSIHILKSGDHFGGYNLKKKVDDLKWIVNEQVTCLKITKEDIESVIGSLSRLGESCLPVSSKYDRHIQFSDIEKVRLLGIGSFGKVWLCTVKNRDQNTPYALKIMSKHEILHQNQDKAAIREKNILASVDHPFLATIISTFQDKNYLYVLQYCIQGGELFTLMQFHSMNTSEMGCLPDHQAKFYAGCVFQALIYLHQCNIAYRDLKPENVMIDKDGFVVVIDFGFAKIVPDKTYTTCGTPEYMAPEIILRKGHSKAVDYWALGVLIYEMLVGRSPFNMDAASPAIIFRRIVKLQYEFPASKSSNGSSNSEVINKEAKDLIWRLICPNKSKRLGCLAGGGQEIGDHAWFDELDFDKILKKESKTPWTPQIDNPLDSSNFEDWDGDDDGIAASIFDKISPLKSEQQELFKDFTPEYVDLIPSKPTFNLGALLACCFPKQ